ncbi:MULTISPECIES: potassium/proton antiporter [unclassified Shewanella]|jgi:cell volume regulation protein A|uniref:potassium/proton antiporter n=1 Tax=Shewanella TaxID=22 RepID=UPI0021D96CCE|nr:MULTISPECIES: potassium/proton antiporter [unclassified Shewanella]MCU8003156.1 potassium/proton antiporter [Shewanella sp. SM96]MCU8034269.1 potassium/proton antiporter [Shewanella sp. SM71]MCU8059409.1 potassium/proton antiporter [Shewanella sp. SM55]MCU8068815.1 potassium/proton antiporter [Shewanella sp. SM32]MCU8087949.1 potassium/proton antiporter [Shewanella sp. SM21]
MFVIDQIILLAAILIILGILSSKLSARLGLPVLVLFLMVGMLAGEDGPGGIVFDNAQIAHALGSLALAIILFDGGLQTPIASIKQVWKPASVLATLGVLVTAMITGAAAAYILDVSLLYGLLIGAIVGSTDAAAVFSLLRNAGIHINPRLKATLEIESATNDPMAIFLTVGLLEIMVKGLEPGTGLLMLFIQQMGIGSAVGLAAGWLSVRIINRIHLTTSGLYPVMVAAFGLLSFGVAANLGGSGFLAIFIAGVVIGNSRFVFQRSTFLFHDGLAWLGQIVMFVFLGLLINPSSLLDVWQEGLMIAIVLTLIARPLSVIPVLKIFGFNAREITLVSWVGLRGSVPIILAIYPLIYGLPGASLIFSVVFFVVLISATIQGSTLPWVARALGLTEPPPATPAATLEITALGDVDADIVEYQLGDTSRASGRRLSQMALPDGTVVAMITRGNNVIPPRGSTFLYAGDHLFIVMKPDVREFVDLVCSGVAEANHYELPTGELKLKGYTKVADLKHSYGIELSANDNLSLDEVLRQSLTDEPTLGASKDFGEVILHVREMVGSRIATVGIVPNSANEN